MNNPKLQNHKLKLKLDAEKERYSAAEGSFNGIRSRCLALLSVEMVLITYFFSDLRSIIPSEIYGIIFFAIGIISIIASAGLSLYSIRPITWPDPIGPEEYAKLDYAKDENECLKVFANDYTLSAEEAKRLTAKQAQIFKYSLLLFVFGLIMLLIIKFF